ncbi:MAG: hypothetical protein JSV13_06560 [Nitrospiraceae bacterium]|nr:MAG: hypothetical protein JSV13_06560 [Nitrospiraceae bacterium]
MSKEISGVLEVITEIKDASESMSRSESKADPLQTPQSDKGFADYLLMVILTVMASLGVAVLFFNL